MRKALQALAAGAAGLAMACPPAAAQPRSPPPSASKADQQRAAVLQAFGGAYEGPLAAYVTRVGDRMAEVAGQGGRCRFTVLDTDVVNAMATPPGCDVYVTRGLLGLIRSEDELAAVLGHEVGHVAARHASRRQTTSVLTGLGALVVGAVTGSGALANIASQAGQLGVLSYSRSQEFEADSLGLRYLALGGYSPMGLADMLSALQADDQLEAMGRPDAKQTPAWSRTHPLTGDRVARAVAGARTAGPAKPQAVGAFLDQVDGLLWGDNPAQGFIIGRRFVHPEMGIGFTAPQGFRLTNSPQAVGVQGPGGQAVFAAGRPGSADDLRGEAYAVLREVTGGAQISAREVQPLRTGGFEGVNLWADAQSNAGPVELMVAVFPAGRGTLHFVTLAPRGQGQAMVDLVQSFHKLGAAEITEARPRRIRVVTVKPGDTAAALAAGMAVDEHRRETFDAINGLQTGDELQPGDRVKLITTAAR
jgi:predicted Zn-dependent protease